jgi:2-amino-4-hydroxy-6-hydroxymethyldihydropteridine diphosphokinase
MRAGIALGSNVGDRLTNLHEARARISGSEKVAPPILSSALFETEPVGCAPGTKAFFNAVMEIDFQAQPMTLLTTLRRIEKELGRSHEAVRNAPRTIDLDLLYFGDSGDFEFNSSTFVLPHPRLHLRRFVLQPLADIRPDLRLPNQSETVADLLARLPDSPTVVRIASEW